MSRVMCGNCGWAGNDRGLHTISDITQRLDPGSEVPSCECPDCGGLCYEAKPVTPFKAHIIWGANPVVRRRRSPAR